MPGQRVGTALHTHPATRGLGKEFPFLVLDRRDTGGCQSGGYQSGTQGGGDRTTIPYDQRHSNCTDQHTLPTQWRS